MPGFSLPEIRSLPAIIECPPLPYLTESKDPPLIIYDEHIHLCTGYLISGFRRLHAALQGNYTGSPAQKPAYFYRTINNR